MTDDLIARLRLLQRYHGDNDAGEAADALEAQARRIAELEEDIDRDDEWAKGFIEKTDARIAELKAALKPFADFISCVSGSKHFEQMSDNHIVITTGAGETEKWIYMKHLRAARAALGEKE